MLKSFNHIVWQERSNLAASAHLAIVTGLLEAWRRCSARNTIPQEPDFVAGLVLETSPTLWKLFNDILRPHQISFSLFGVFCHQTPRVRYPGITKSYTEIGDLLLVHAHRKRSGAFLRNALLYQAKMSSRQPYHVPQAERHQLTLYTDWPEFEYYNSPPLSGQRRAITPNAPHTGAQYLLIDDRLPSDPRSGFQLSDDTYPIGSCMADSYLHDHNHLAGEMVDFLLGRSGRPFAGEPKRPASDGWSQLIWDLITVSLGKAFNRRRSGWENVPRGLPPQVELFDGVCIAGASSARVVSTVRDLLGIEGVSLLYGSPPGREERATNDERPVESGISMLLFETAEEGEGGGEEG